MSQIISIGYLVEGATDVRFLENIIKRTFEDVALHSDRDIDIFQPRLIRPEDKSSFVRMVHQASLNADEEGLGVLCIHCDADNDTDENVMNNKINPAYRYISEQAEKSKCSLLPVVPIRMTEAWMLADKELLKVEINTILSDKQLNIEKRPERYADPKNAIESAIRIAQSALTRRRRNLTIGELYSPLGQKIAIEKLKEIPSYKKFYDQVVTLLNPSEIS